MEARKPTRRFVPGRHCPVTGKQRFRTVEDALREERRIRAQYRVSRPDREGRVPYVCDHCNAWHLGRITPNVVRRNRAADAKWARIRATTLPYAGAPDAGLRAG